MIAFIIRNMILEVQHKAMGFIKIELQLKKYKFKKIHHEF